MFFNVVCKSVIRIMYPSELKRYAFYIKPTVRLCLIAVFVRSTFSITVSWTSAISLILLLVSYLFSWSKKIQKKRKKDEDTKLQFDIKELENPFKGKIGSDHLTEEKEKEIAFAIEEHVVEDASHANCLERFQVIKSKTECIFARRAKIWGSPDYDESFSLEENIRSVYISLLKFTFALKDLGLSGYVLELPGHLYGSNITNFGNAMRRTLLTLKTEDKKRFYKQKLKSFKSSSKLDRTELKDTDLKEPFVENTKLWARKFWVFEINQITFFITTFAPFYPETNSRYNFGCKDCYILFQPEISFAVHDLPPDTPNTNWVKPVTVRDKIRVAFHHAGRGYDPPLVKGEPLVYDMVKRISPEDEVTPWWDMNENGL